MSYEQPSTSPALPPLTPAEERQWAMFSHFSVLLNLVTGFLGVVAPLVIYTASGHKLRFRELANLNREVREVRQEKDLNFAFLACFAVKKKRRK